ncbi:FHA domain-containing protein [Nocardioides litoris]|uniref:FHA domain-containing protein n=1 Tax=Nocardioides litoris TaxID=1926648 RepID=UPI0011204273|nr:FHA domain-containing protein [Nocardioides litoris]
MATGRSSGYWISDGLTIGSASGCDVRLDGLAPRHATVRSAPGDEYVVVLHEPGHVHGARVGGRTVLRTGSRVELGPHVLVYHREEYADHGRPHGGRLGGELGRQLPQGEPGR